MAIVLPFPPASLSGHAKGHWRGKSAVTKQWRAWAFAAALAAKVRAPADGDIVVTIRFVPPDRRGDRTNYPNRCKPIFDGLADAMKVNDRRFVPAYQFAEPEKPGRLEIVIGGAV
jgi:crossover junction endodeoxyribonuclease RusA